jgi:hypothetical protein
LVCLLRVRKTVAWCAHDFRFEWLAYPLDLIDGSYISQYIQKASKFKKVDMAQNAIRQVLRTCLFVLNKYCTKIPKN